MPEPTATSPLALQTAVQLGVAIRRARLARNFTLKDFAARARVSLNTVRRIEGGDAAVGFSFWLAALETASLLHLLAQPSNPSADTTGAVRRRLEERKRATGMKRRRASLGEDYEF
jgi:transcriptional regulator with XRE-family HTH domain